jgi:hypothetical protein
MIRFTCSCGKQLQAKDEHAGRTTRCPDCGRELQIAASSEAIQPEAPKRRPYVDADDDDEERVRRRPAEHSGKATASLILGIFAFFCSILTGIPAIILGIMALADVGNSRRRVTGRGAAVAGIVLGSVGMLMSIVCLPVSMGLLLPAVQKVREAANRMSSANNLKQLALAMHNYNETYGSFPPAAVYDKRGKPLYSWRVLLLPYLENQNLYEQFHKDEPWDSPHNKTLIQQMPKIFRDPLDPPDTSMTRYQVLVGGGALFDRGPPLHQPAGPRVADVTDGLANTIMIVESANPVSWTKPEDLTYDPTGPLPAFKPEGFNAVFADGAVHFVKKGTSEQQLRGAITRSGNERINPNDFGDRP